MNKQVKYKIQQTTSNAHNYYYNGITKYYCKRKGFSKMLGKMLGKHSNEKPPNHLDSGV